MHSVKLAHPSNPRQTLLLEGPVLKLYKMLLALIYTMLVFKALKCIYSYIIVVTNFAHINNFEDKS